MKTIYKLTEVTVEDSSHRDKRILKKSHVSRWKRVCYSLAVWRFKQILSAGLKFHSHLSGSLPGKWEILIFNICLGAGSRQYCQYTKSPLGVTPLKEIWASPRVKENLTSVEFEPTTSGLDLPMPNRLSYEASTGADRGNLGSESRYVFKWYRYR